MADELRSCLDEARISIREAERRLEMGQGTLQSMLSGRVALRTDDIAAVAMICGLDLGDVWMRLGEEEGKGKVSRRRRLPKTSGVVLENPTDEELKAKFRAWLLEFQREETDKKGEDGGE